MPHAKISHAVAIITNAGQPTGFLYPFCPDDLGKLLARHWALLPAFYVRTLMRDLLQAVSHLHDHGLAHRDIKPDNILVDWPGSGIYAKLADWGWARDIVQPTGEPALKLTPGAVTVPYRAPEIELGAESYGLSVDMWSVGIVLHELLTGLRFAPQAHNSRKVKDKLMYWISRLAGPITEDLWPGVTAFQHWKANAEIVAAATAAGVPQGSLWDATRRPVCPAGRTLADAILQLRPTCRATAKQALEYDFFSGGASAPAAPCSGKVAIATANKAAQTEDNTQPTGGDVAAASGTAAPCIEADGASAPRRDVDVAAACKGSDMTSSTDPATGGGAPGLAACQQDRPRDGAVPIPALAEGGEPVGCQQDRPRDGAVPTPALAEGEEVVACHQDGPREAVVEHPPPPPWAPPKGTPPKGSPPLIRCRGKLSREQVKQLRTVVKAKAAAPAVKRQGSLLDRESGSQVVERQGSQHSRESGSQAVEQQGSRLAGESASRLCQAWTPRAKPVDPKKWNSDSDGQRCACMGFCRTYRAQAHMFNKSSPGQCNYVAEGSSSYCLLCACLVDGCTGLGCELMGTCRKAKHMWLPYPAPLRAVLDFGPALVKMEPVDLSEFLHQSKNISDILLLALLADVWEPTACRILAREFKALRPTYTAADLARCFDIAFEELNQSGGMVEATVDDVRKTHLEILSIGGVCRHFGLQSLGKRLHLLNSDCASGPVASSYQLGLTHKRCKRQKGNLRVLEALLATKESIGIEAFSKAQKLCRKGAAAGCGESIADFVFNSGIPVCLSWGRSRTAYHGLHIVRKIFLKFYHTQKPEQWHLPPESLKVASPDKGEHCIKMPLYMSSREGNLRRAFRPVDPTRISMWTCLLNVAFAKVPGFQQAFCQGRVTLELWDAARLHLNSTFGHSPHPKQVATLAMAMLAGKSPGEVLISSVWGSYKPS